MASYFGVAKELITPTIKTTISCSGVFSQLFERIHDDISVKTLIIDDGREKLILMTFDLLFHSGELKEALREYAMTKYKVKPEALIVNYSHSHLAPSARGYDNGNTTEEYEEFLLDRSKACIDKAFANIFEGSIEYGSVYGDWSVSRRKQINGVWSFGPNFEGLKDNELAVVAIWDTDNMLRGLWLDYSCHPVFNSDFLGISADYPGRICQILECRHYGCTAGFIQGAGGSARPKLTVSAGGFRKHCPFSELDQMAGSIAQAVDDLLISKKMKSFVPDICAREFVIELPLDVKPLKHFEDAAISEKLIELFKYNARKVIAEYDSMPDYLPARCGVVKLSEQIYIAHVCGEPCYEVKLLIKSILNDKTVLFIGYTDSIAYMVTDKLLTEGGYESSCFLEYALKGPFMPGIDSKFEKAFKAAYDEIVALRP